MTVQQSKRSATLSDHHTAAPVSNASLAAARKAVEAELSARANGGAEAIAEARAEDFRAWRRRTVADLIGLSRLCQHRRCQRKRRCCCPRAPCIAAHRDEVCDRLGTLLGYRADDLWDDDADLTW